MSIFWDSSAFLPLLVKEATTPLVKPYFEETELLSGGEQKWNGGGP